MKTSSRLAINNLKESFSLSENYVREEWSKLEKALFKIYKSEPPETALEELYRIVENLCTENLNEFLYDNLYMVIDTDVKNKLQQFCRPQSDFLTALNDAWVNFCKHSILIKNIFLYLDRKFILKNQYLTSVWFMSLALFKENIVLNPTMKTNLVGGLLGLIARERDGKTVDRNLLKSLISMLVELQVYEEVFESQFLQVTETLYKLDGQIFVSKYQITEYLDYVRLKLDEEQERVKNYLDNYTKHSLLEVVETQLLKEHLQDILDRGVYALFEQNLVEKMTLLYELVGRLPNGQSKLCSSVGEYLKKRGRLVIIDPEHDKNMIQDLLAFKDKVDNIVLLSYKNNEKFKNIVRESFKAFINQRHNKPAELLAKFVDSKLRCKELNEEEIEEILNKTMVLFRFVQGKDVFEAFYKRDLAKRLLVGKSVSQDAENSMISKLKQECGGGFTSKLEGMFKDVSVSQSLNGNFKAYLNHLQETGNVSTNLDLCVNVLTSSYWPTYLSYEITLPAEMVLYQNIFLKFYLGNHSGRKLQWQPNLGHCLLKASFSNGNKELQVSLFQTIILLLFNSSEKLSYSEIAESLYLEKNELNRTLQSLACGKARVLTKCPKGKEIEEGDIFLFNNEFTDKLFRIKINQIQMKETVEEQRATEDGVIQDRQFQIDAAVVRIMKQKKSLTHNLLLSELYIVLDIPVKPADLKKRIELLIERDYIERDKENASVYKYIA